VNASPLAPVPLPPDDHPARWRALVVLSVAELLGMSLWFAASAAAPALAERWSLTAGQTGWLTTAVQVGFVLGTAFAALLNLADVVPSRVLFPLAALLGALANVSLVWSGTFEMALLGRLLTGACLAGVYPPAMKMIATWFRARRGLAVGTVVGALTIGKATPYLVRAFPGASPETIVIVASAAAALAALLVAVLYRDGPYPFPPRRFSWSLAGDVLRTRRWRLATGGYLGHMFELYSYWTWIPMFIAASMAASATGTADAHPTAVSIVSFLTIAVGGAGCIWGGLWADRHGRERLVTLSLLASGSCALIIGLAFGGPLWVVALVALVWGFFVVADSAQFSVMVTESVPPHAVGTALTLQTSLGFLLTTVSIQLVPPIANVVGWQWAFAILALGPVAGIASVRRLVRLRPAASRVPG